MKKAKTEKERIEEMMNAVGGKISASKKSEMPEDGEVGGLPEMDDSSAPDEDTEEMPMEMEEGEIVPEEECGECEMPKRKGLFSGKNLHIIIQMGKQKA